MKMNWLLTEFIITKFLIQ